MKLEELINEQETEDKLFMVRVRGNFYGGKYYETGIDSLFVSASSPDEAVKIAKDNIEAVEQHFRTKKYHSGKMAIAKKDKKKFKPEDIVDAKVTKQVSHPKVLNRDGKVKPV